MTVRQLIKKLQKYPPETPVGILDRQCDGCEEIGEIAGGYQNCNSFFDSLEEIKEYKKTNWSYDETKAVYMVGIAKKRD